MLKQKLIKQLIFIFCLTLTTYSFTLLGPYRLQPDNTYQNISANSSIIFDFKKQITNKSGILVIQNIVSVLACSVVDFSINVDQNMVSFVLKEVSINRRQCVKDQVRELISRMNKVSFMSSIVNSQIFLSPSGKVLLRMIKIQVNKYATSLAGVWQAYQIQNYPAFSIIKANNSVMQLCNGNAIVDYRISQRYKIDRRIRSVRNCSQNSVLNGLYNSRYTRNFNQQIWFYDSEVQILMKWKNLADLPGDQEIQFPRNKKIVNNEINSTNDTNRDVKIVPQSEQKNKIKANQSQNIVTNTINATNNQKLDVLTNKIIEVNNQNSTIQPNKSILTNNQNLNSLQNKSIQIDDKKIVIVKNKSVQIDILEAGILINNATQVIQKKIDILQNSNVVPEQKNLQSTNTTKNKIQAKIQDIIFLNATIPIQSSNVTIKTQTQNQPSPKPITLNVILNKSIPIPQKSSNQSTYLTNIKKQQIFTEWYLIGTFEVIIMAITSNRIMIQGNCGAWFSIVNIKDANLGKMYVENISVKNTMSTCVGQNNPIQSVLGNLSYITIRQDVQKRRYLKFWNNQDMQLGQWSNSRQR